MKIKLDKQAKIGLLKAIQIGILDTDTISELKTLVEKYRPARVLSPKELREYMNQIEEEY